MTAFLALEAAAYDFPRKAPAALGMPKPAYPWVARVLRGAVATGRVYLEREFQERAIDFSQANSVGSRGVRFCWTLAPGLYEGNRQPQPSKPFRGERFWFAVSEEGETTEFDREELLARLDIRGELERMGRGR